MSASTLHSYAPAGALLLTMFLAPAIFGQGQSLNLIADIPFDFTAGGATLTAGKYRITLLNTFTIAMASLERGGGQAAVTTYLAGGGSAREVSELIFNRYGNTYFLKQVWREGMAVGHGVPKSKQEDAALFRAAAQAAPVVVAARNSR